MMAKLNHKRFLGGTIAAAAVAAAAVALAPAPAAQANMIVHAVHDGGTPFTTYGSATSISNSLGGGKTSGSGGYRGGPGSLGAKDHYFVLIRSYSDGSGSVTRASAGYFQFNISAAKAAGGNLNDAVFRLTAFDGYAPKTGTFTILALNDGAQDNWDPTDTDTYLTMPGVDLANSDYGQLTFDPNTTTKLGTIAVGGSTLIQSNTTDLNLDSFLASDTNGLVTLIAYSSFNDEPDFFSNSYGSGEIRIMGAAVGDTNPDDPGSAAHPENWPSLLLPNAGPSTVPEPASLALMGLGGLALLRRRRKV